MVRVAGLEKIYPNIRKIPEAIMSLRFVGFSKTIHKPLAGWDSLKPYDVAIINGWKILEKNVTGTRSLTRVASPGDLFNLIELGRAEIVLYGQWLGLQYIHDKGLSGIKLLSPPLAEKETFIYLHKKHQSLVPRAAQAIRDMKADGSFQRITDQTLGHLLKK